MTWSPVVNRSHGGAYSTQPLWYRPVISSVVRPLSFGPLPADLEFTPSQLDAQQQGFGEFSRKKQPALLLQSAVG